MADFDFHSSDLDDDRPLAVRRTRRRSDGSNILSSPVPQKNRNTNIGINTPPTTPQRTKKRVRFSDPGPIVHSTGLTPFIRRSSLGTPSSARRTSASSSRWNLQIDDSPISGTLQFEPLRQVLGGRVQRRLRRNRLSEEVNIIESEKRDEERARRETQALRAQIREKDLEIVHLREQQGIVGQTEEEYSVEVNMTDGKVQELEAQVAELRAEIEAHHGDPDWTMAAKDPWDQDDDMGIPNFDDDAMSDIITSTPSRHRRSFPSPPTTAPATPSTGLAGVDAMAEATFPDPEVPHLRLQLSSLASEVTSLQRAIETTQTTHSRLLAKLAPHTSPETADLDLVIDEILTSLALSQSSAQENSTRFSALSTEITGLGFSLDSSALDAAISLISSQFRSARIELERLHPGETTTGFENSKLLGLLIDRLRVLTERVQQQDSDIDQYHEQEISLRSQLGTRVDVQRSLEASLTKSKNQITGLENEIGDRDMNIAKLGRALEGYRAEVTNLESLVTRMASEHAESVQQLKESTQQTLNTSEERLLTEQLAREMAESQRDGLRALVDELSQRLESVATTLERMNADMTSRNSTISQQKDVIALGDARLVELRAELERVNDCLRDAHSSILTLQGEKAGLERKVGEGEERLERILTEMRRRLNEVIEAAGGECSASSAAGETDAPKESSVESAIIRAGQFFSGKLARRSGGGSAKKRRRYDSGLGFLEEEAETAV